MSHGGGGGAGADNGVSPGNVPVCYYGPAGRVPAAVERRVRAAELFLRCAACGLAVLAAALLGSDRQTRVFFSVQKEARYTDMQSLAFLVIANGMAACYSLLQGARCLVSILTGGVLISRPMAWAIFSCDQASVYTTLLSVNKHGVPCVQVMAYFTISAVAVAMEAAMIGKYGNTQFQWMKTCHLYKRFCAQAGGAVACAVAASLNMVGISLVSAFNLFRLYGSGKGRK
ncbi:CASP-like protein 2U2 [Dichanthelium oligosanthes]|uniref:CASP-like protein n=1 Tax=Dichanthelium oligosanthes TaxID=888268 RepID=A0A1E5UNX7_9POAL|nr:CASP-like protein 2U2 [Dichanthelium oligosanthes]